jgi:hypothetical protein
MQNGAVGFIGWLDRLTRNIVRALDKYLQAFVYAAVAV